MGNRGQIKVEQRGDDPAVYLYSHWNASGLPALLARALQPGERWDDHEYLARIIFDKLSADTSRDHLGVGIGTNQHGDVWRVIEVDPDEQELRFLADTGFDHQTDERAGETYSFEEFVASELGDNAVPTGSVN